jgi:two-component SAPR family response regulator
MDQAKKAPTVRKAERLLIIGTDKVLVEEFGTRLSVSAKEIRTMDFSRPLDESLTEYIPDLVFLADHLPDDEGRTVVLQLQEYAQKHNSALIVNYRRAVAAQA